MMRCDRQEDAVDRLHGPGRGFPRCRAVLGPPAASSDGPGEGEIDAFLRAASAAAPVVRIGVGRTALNSVAPTLTGNREGSLGFLLWTANRRPA